MKYRDNIVYFVRKEFEIKEKEKKDNQKKQKNKQDIKYNAYKSDLISLKTICENKGIDTAEKWDYFIKQVEKDTKAGESNNIKIIGSTIISSAFTGVCFPIISENLKADIKILPLFILFLLIVYANAYAITTIVEEVKYRFSRKERNKKMLKMLYDIKLLYYLEENTDDRE